jgi:hypothetical protein
VFSPRPICDVPFPLRPQGGPLDAVGALWRRTAISRRSIPTEFAQDRLWCMETPGSPVSGQGSARSWGMGGTPLLALEEFNGPLERLLTLARTQQIDSAGPRLPSWSTSPPHSERQQPFMWPCPLGCSDADRLMPSGFMKPNIEEEDLDLHRPLMRPQAVVFSSCIAPRIFTASSGKMCCMPCAIFTCSASFFITSASVAPCATKSQPFIRSPQCRVFMVPSPGRPSGRAKACTALALQ